jgi:hypothetical protein
MPPVIFVSHSVHSTLTPRQLHLAALKLRGIRTSRSPHSLALALTLLRAGELESALKFNERNLFGWQLMLIPCARHRASCGLSGHSIPAL